jgi:cytidine deaminase|tara:strand:+ start:718 stop:1098 length:381 start_codon:yes stop_codon:yes gene_type:complete
MNKLIAEAIIARETARAPYSGYRVGCAVKCDDGSVYHGANVEASCSSVGICAERIALANAVLAGKTPIQLAIVGEAEAPLSPCGTCRQFMLDFAPLKVILANMNGDEKHTTASKLLPLKFERRSQQ